MFILTFRSRANNIGRRAIQIEGIEFRAHKLTPFSDHRDWYLWVIAYEGKKLAWGLSGDDCSAVEIAYRWLEENPTLTVFAPYYPNNTD